MFLTERTIQVKDGRVTIEVHADDGEKVFVTIETVPKLRSLKANRYYFGAKVRKIAEMSGMTVKQVHASLKVSFNPEQVPNLLTGEMMTIGGSTREMTSEEFKIFSDKADEVLEFLNAQFPSQDEYWKRLEGNHGS
jgi:hypothetical protein